MRRVLKWGGLAILAVAAAGVGFYFYSLRIPGEPALQVCRAVELVDDVTGEKVVGAEDLDYDPETGTVFLSAYDRRAVAREIDAGKVATQGGIYAFRTASIAGKTRLSVRDVSRNIKGAQDFLPHGFAMAEQEEGLRLFVINRVYVPRTREKTQLMPFIEVLDWDGAALNRAFTLYDDELCHPNDIAVFGQRFLVSNDRVGCAPESGSWRGLRGGSEGSVMEFGGSAFSTAISPLGFPNGLAFPEIGMEVAAVTLTRDKALRLYRRSGHAWHPIGSEKLPAAPDNLTADEGGNLYVTGFPSLLDYYFYIKGWVGKSPSAAYRIDPETFEQTLLFKNEGSLISGATTALRAGDYLILGAGWDDHIAVCEGMEALP